MINSSSKKEEDNKGILIYNKKFGSMFEIKNNFSFDDDKIEKVE